MYMAAKDVIRISLLEDNNVVSVSSSDPELNYRVYMTMVEKVVMSTQKFSKHEIESYIVEWANRITDYKNN